MSATATFQELLTGLHRAEKEAEALSGMVTILAATADEGEPLRVLEQRLVSLFGDLAELGMEAHFYQRGKGAV